MGKRFSREIRTCVNPNCDVTFRVIVNSKRKYCSVGCAAKVNGVERRGNNNPAKRPDVRKKISISLTGKVCGSKNGMYGNHHSKETKEKQRRAIRRRGGHKGEKNPNWKGGLSVSLYSLEFYKVRRKIRERDNDTCQLCGKIGEHEIKDTGKGLPIHHIDYNKKNNRGSNLITLCNRCNGKVNANRDYWITVFSDQVKNKVECLYE